MGKENTCSVAEKSPRRRLFQWMAARLVRLLEGSSTAREGLDLLSAILRSLLSAWNGASMTGGRNGFCWVHRGRRRWGEVSAAPQARWRLPVIFWRLSDGF